MKTTFHLQYSSSRCCCKGKEKKRIEHKTRIEHNSMGNTIDCDEWMDGVIFLKKIGKINRVVS